MADPLQTPVLEASDENPPVHPFLVTHLRKKFAQEAREIKLQGGLDGAINAAMNVALQDGASAVINYLEHLSKGETE